MCCHEMNHLHAIIRYHFFDFDVCVVIFNVSYIESFYEKYSMFGKSKILCMSFSVIETYDQLFGYPKLKCLIKLLSHDYLIEAPWRGLK